MDFLLKGEGERVGGLPTVDPALFPAWKLINPRHN